MRILHLSDTHIERIAGPNRHGVDATESLRLMLGELRHQRGVDAMIVTGDIADDGAVESYTLARELIGGFAARLGVPLFFTTGNHDDRAAFGKVLGSGHLAVDGSDAAKTVLSSAEGEKAAVSVVRGYRFITLDSLIPGQVYGGLSDAQLDWLNDLLRTTAERGTIVAFHHPPIAMDVDTQRAFGLRNPRSLAEVLRGSDVRVVLTGHFHLQLLGLLAAIPVWVGPAVVNRIDLTARPGAERAVRGASASVVDVGGAAGPLFHTLHARDPRAHETVYELDEDQVLDVIEARGWVR
ncbi:metallophosphoesterase [Streptomyces sp. NPDC004610]|uniref:metallophosphoesterase family protein n=1 Tax=unclassified Streptomyces TaxID=2593676 RepID=UPI0033A63524